MSQQLPAEHLTMWLAAGLLVWIAAFLTFVPSGATAGSGMSVECTGVWANVASPNPPGQTAGLAAVFTVSQDDAWAVGSSSPSQGGPTGAALALHWDGETWEIVPTPEVNAASTFSGVSGSSSTDVWAVGSSSTSFNDPNSSALIQHWDGIEWSIVPADDAGGSATLSSVVALSPIDAWAVGSRSEGQEITGLIQHWDGSAWSIVPSPQPDVSVYLSAIAAVAPNDIWVVGVSTPDFPSFPNSIFHTLIEHWDGNVWTLVESPDAAPGGYNALRGLAVVSATDIWAVGGQGNSGSGGNAALIEHWDGNAWSIAAGPQQPIGQRGQGFFAAAANDPSNVWAVGPDISRWNGTSWAISEPSHASATYSGVAAVPGSEISEVWAVGTSSSPGNFSTFIQHFCDEPLVSTSLVAPAPSGTSEIQVLTNTGFAIGDRVIVNPGGPNEETSEIAGFGSLVLATPLQFDHEAGEVVQVLLSGDVNCDGAVDSVDALQVLRRVSQLGSPALCGVAADVDCSGEETSVDALLILRFAARLPETPIPAGCRSIST